MSRMRSKRHEYIHPVRNYLLRCYADMNTSLSLYFVASAGGSSDYPLITRHHMADEFGVPFSLSPLLSVSIVIRECKPLAVQGLVLGVLDPYSERLYFPLI